jgi:PAS domain S-box-containing protein
MEHLMMLPERDFPTFGLIEDNGDGGNRLYDDVSTQTIDLDQAFDSRLSESGSFLLGRLNMAEFAKLFQAIPVPVFLVDQAGSIVFLTDSCCKISGDYQAFKGRPFTDMFLQPSARKGIQITMAEVFHTRRSRTVNAVMAADSRAMWGRVHLRPLRMGNARYLLILIEDLTIERAQLILTRRHQQSLQNEIAQRKKAEEAIRQSELKYRILFDNAPIGMASVDQEGTILFVNAKASEILGYSVGDLPGQAFASFVHDEDRHVLSEAKQEALSTTSSADGYVCRMTSKDSATRWVEIKSVDIDWNGVPATLKFMQDVTNKRKLEEEFAKIQKLESMGLLAGGIAHDFNNILTAILGNISLGKTTLKALEETVSRLSAAEHACERAQGLTQQLLTFAKGGAPVKRPSALRNVIEESSRFALQGSNVSCDVNSPDDLWPAEIDAAQIGQVMQNLVINAAQAMPEGGTVRVRAENVQLPEPDDLPLGPGEYVQITVQDQGDGIADEVLPHIFDPFFTTKSHGSGLGLATAYSIVRNHGGVITVDTNKGAGSLFYVYLPATRKTPECFSRRDDTPTPGRGRILIMDDEDAVRDVLTTGLAKLGYQVQAARHGDEALELHSSALRSANPFDAVVLDLTVPGGMGGKEAALRIRSQDSEVRLIVSSGYSNDPVMANYREFGIDSVVPKPYTLAELSRAVRCRNGKACQRQPDDPHAPPSS